MFGWLKKAPLSSITILLSVGIGVVTNLVTNEFSWLLVGGLAALIVLTLWIDYSQHNKTPDTTQIDRKNREILLRKIAYRSAAALPNAGEHIDLRLAAAEQYLQPAIVELRADRVERDLPQQPISRIFEANGQKLLVLGEPGSGKTTLLYQLASQLTIAAQQDAEKPIPLIINLSSWPKRPAGAGFEDWLLAEMHLGYDIPKLYGQKLLADRQVSLLLDGLDEVAETSREACLEEIDRYFRNLMPVAVCCRTKEYELLRRKLHFEFAVRIKPLTPEQISSSLETLQLSRLTQAWQRHEALREVLTTPLMVRVAATALASEALPEAELTDAASASKALWRAYARHALHTKKKAEETRHPAPYAEAEIWRWMQWLARTLNKRDLTNFYVERMQPDMLPESKMLFFRVLDIMSYGFASGLAFGMALGLTNGLVLGLAFGLMFSLTLGLTFGLAYGLAESIKIYLKRFLPLWISNLLAFGLAGSLCGSLIGYLAEMLKTHFAQFLPMWIINFLAGGQWRGLVDVWILGLSFGLITGLIIGLIVDSLLIKEQDELKIIPIEQTDLKLNLANFLRHLMLGLALGLAVGLVLGLAGGLAVGLAVGLATGLDSQFSSYSIKDEFRAKPNEGIHKSGRFAFQFSLIGLTIMLLSFIFQDLFFLQYPLDGKLKVYDLLYLLGAAMMWFLPDSKGGSSYYRHYILRFLLYRSGCIPYRYVNFLEYACRLGFLKRVGGGYTFYHRELRDFIVQEEKMP